MKCQNCNSESACIHLTQIVDDEMKTLHLCERCAAEKWLETSTVPENFPLTDFLAKMSPEERSSTDPGTGLTCSFCGLEFSEFKELGRLGCPHCWSSFEAQLRGLLRRKYV